MRHVLGQELLPDDWTATANLIRETGGRILGVSSGGNKVEKETWWWNGKVQKHIHRQKLAKKK